MKKSEIASAIVARLIATSDGEPGEIEMIRYALAELDLELWKERNSNDEGGSTDGVQSE